VPKKFMPHYCNHSLMTSSLRIVLLAFLFNLARWNILQLVTKLNFLERNCNLTFSWEAIHQHPLPFVFTKSHLLFQPGLCFSSCALNSSHPGLTHQYACVSCISTSVLSLVFPPRPFLTVCPMQISVGLYVVLFDKVHNSIELTEFLWNSLPTPIIWFGLCFLKKRTTS
jgi:hypothetical protein